MASYEVRCEELYTEDYSKKYIFCKIQDLPCAVYLGGNEWEDLNGQHYLVEE